MPYVQILSLCLALGLFFLSAELLFQDLHSQRVSLCLNLAFRLLAFFARLCLFAVASGRPSAFSWEPLPSMLLSSGLAALLLWPLPIGLADKRYIASLFLLFPLPLALGLCLVACLWACCREAWRSSFQARHRFPFLPYLCLCTWPPLCWQCWPLLQGLTTSQV